MSHENMSTPTRRSVLRSLAGASIVVGGTTLAGTAAAEGTNVDPREQESHARLQANYETVADVRRSFDRHAGEVLAVLADEGLLPTTDPGALTALERGGDVADAAQSTVERAPTDGDGAPIKVMTTVDSETDTETAVLRVRESTSDVDVTVFVLPEAGRSYATVDREDQPKRLITTESSTADSEEISADSSDVGTDEIYHDIHGKWELEDTYSNCDYDAQCGNHSTCVADGLPGCVADLHYENTYEVYECGKVDYGPNGEEYPCSATKTELVNQHCSFSCCNNERGLACDESECSIC